MTVVQPVTLITGASAGIGMAVARVFAENGHTLALVARRDQSLNTLANEIAAAGCPRPTVIPLDLARNDAAAVIASELADRGLEPQYVVNNAGFGLLGTAAMLDRAEQLAMIDVNVRALTELSLAFIDSLSRHKGGILNVASVAGFMPGPRMAVYYATKAFVISFSEALHRELKRRDIRVTVLCPGPVATEFQARAGIPDGYHPGILDWSAEQVAREGYRGLMIGRRRVVPGFGNKILTTLVPRVVPRGLLLRTIELLQSGRLKARPTRQS